MRVRERERERESDAYKVFGVCGGEVVSLQQQREEIMPRMRGERMSYSISRSLVVRGMISSLSL